MAFHFSANQFDKAYGSVRLGNWELPKYYPKHPRTLKGSTTIIANDNGHLLPHVKKSDKNPWGYFRSTYQLPDKLTRKFANEYNECLIRRDKWKHFEKSNSRNVCEDHNLGVEGTFDLSKCEPPCETIKHHFPDEPKAPIEKVNEPAKQGQ